MQLKFKQPVLDVSGFPRNSVYAFLCVNGSLDSNQTLVASTTTLELTLVCGSETERSTLLPENGKLHLRTIGDRIFSFAKRHTSIEFTMSKSSKPLPVMFVPYAGYVDLRLIPELNAKLTKNENVLLKKGNSISTSRPFLVTYTDGNFNTRYLTLSIRDVARLMPDRKTLNEIADDLHISKDVPYWVTATMVNYVNHLFSALTLTKLPLTLSSWATRQVVELEKQLVPVLVASGHVNGYERPKSRLCRISNAHPLSSNPSFREALVAFRGGINVTYLSGVFNPKQVTDIDLKSAYNVAGHLIPLINYDKDAKDYAVISSTKFIELMDELNGPYTVGTAQVDLIYPSSANFIPTQATSPDDDRPHYVRQQRNLSVTLTDLYTAIKVGAKATIHRLTVLNQAKLDAHRIETLHYPGRIQDKLMQLRESATNDTDNLLFKQAANTIYGSTARGLNPKQGNSKTLSDISDPNVAGQYTAITRYHLWLLTSVLKEQHAQVTSVTTDGALAVSEEPLDFSKLTQAIALKANYRYVDATKQYVDTFFKFKHETPSELFDLRTRFNGSNDGEIRALSAVSSNVPSCDVLSALHRHQIVFESTPPTYKTLLESKQSTKVKHLTDDGGNENVSKTGVSETYLRYDWSNKPVGFIPDGDLGYFKTQPFGTVKEQRRYRFAADILTKHYFIYTPQNARQFMLTMKYVMNGQLKLTANTLTLSYEIGQFLTFVIQCQDQENVQAPSYSKVTPLTSDDFTELWPKMHQLLEESSEAKTPNFRTVRNRYNALKKKVTPRTAVNWLAVDRIVNWLNRIELSPVTVAA